MKKFTKALSLLLAGSMLTLSLAACADQKPSNTSGNAAGTGTQTGPASTPGSTPVGDVEIYDQILGEFYDAYQLALNAKSVSERFALMAIAEAKLLESGAMMPTTAQGGNYAISKLAPYTVTSVLWGTDSNRYHNALVCDKPIATADRDALKAMWKEKAGTGTWEASAKEYLTSKGYTLKDSYTMGYNANAVSFDIFRTAQATDQEILVNTYDGLVEYDTENVLKPALATEWSTSEDGLTWTFKIRQGVMWVNSLGEDVAELKADDFVAGFQHMLDDPAGNLSYLADGRIVGAHEYISGETADFADVGIKATDDYTLQFTLTTPFEFFDTMLGYGAFAPLNRAFYESKGGKFGPDSESGDYGTSRDNIAYIGPYLITTYIENNSIVFTKNEKYWNKDNINLKTITWLYNDGKIATKAYDDFVAGTLDGCGLNAAALEKAKSDGNFDKYAYVSTPNATSFQAFFNLDREAFANFNNETKRVSPKTDDEKTRSHAALLNHNFRLALTMGLDRAAYNEQAVGADLKLISLTNSYTPGTFVSLPADVTVKINGTDKTYKAGTYYGQIMQDQITADGYPMKVFDPAADGGVGSGTGYDGWYNVEKANEYMNKAIEELKAQGVEISKENPIKLDMAYFNAGSVYPAQANALKQSIEATFDGKVIINLVGDDDQDSYLDATYFFNTGAEANYDINTNTGWGPDYGDPSTYLDTMVKGGGFMTKSLGLDA